jgi:catechol 2,3-dioxygenase-like lactoylglutathione lyase family enzyme
MNAPDLARRFLHVNLNTADADAAQRFLADSLGLRLHMQTDPEVLTDGEILGLTGKVRCDTRFFYDSRGPRASAAIEVIEWLDPATVPCDQTDAASTGLVALGFTVADRAHVVETISGYGFTIISADADGLITGGPAVLVVGNDGVVFEIGEDLDAPSGSVYFAGARIACVALEESLAFYTAIGFRQTDEITSRIVRFRDLGIGTDGGDDIRMCYLELPEDASTTQLCLTQSRTTDVPAARKEPNRQGLYRCALRVENTHKTIEATPDGIAVRGPIWCPLPGTPISGLDIAFMTAPDGVVIEYVERPLAHFPEPGDERKQ